VPHGLNPACLPALVGSLPLKTHAEAVRRMMRVTPEIPSWPQLPALKGEGMIAQFLPGFPGLLEQNGKFLVDGGSEAFPAELTAFYEDYFAVTEGAADLAESRFSLKPDTAQGFFAFLETMRHRQGAPKAVKGQITGPVTFTTAFADQKGAPIFYDLQLRDAAVKLLALKARWQIRQLKALGVPVILFMDEPGMAGFGSSEFTSISREAVSQCFSEVIESIRSEGGMAGIHVCANTDWSLILSLPFDIVNFDAHAYFDRFILYAGEIKRFVAAGGILAWGVIPTLDTDLLGKETVASLLSLWKAWISEITAIGIDRDTLLRQSLITPTCGMGTLPLDLMEKALTLLRDISLAIRNEPPTAMHF